MHPESVTISPPEIIDYNRIRLRRPSISDAEAIFEYASDLQVARLMDWPVCADLESIVEALKKRNDQWHSGTEFYWVITLPSEDRAIGTTSCCVSGHSAEFGYVLNRRYWGNGYATDVSRAIVEWAFSVPSIWRLTATCDTENIASARVLEKSGLSREGVLRRAIIRPNISKDPRDALLYAKVRE